MLDSVSGSPFGFLHIDHLHHLGEPGAKETGRVEQEHKQLAANHTTSFLHVPLTVVSRTPADVGRQSQLHGYSQFYAYLWRHVTIL